MCPLSLLIQRTRNILQIAQVSSTPITGRRLNLSWRIHTLLPEAHAFYQRVEEQLGEKFYHPLPTVRLLMTSVR